MTRQPLIDPEPAQVPLLRVVGVLTVAWAVALVATLLVPALHQGDRSWWRWSAAVGLALGPIGLLVARRQRG